MVAYQLNAFPRYTHTVLLLLFHAEGQHSLHLLNMVKYISNFSFDDLVLYE